MRGTWTMHCIGCEAGIEHPNEDDCMTVNGFCAHLVDAGWRPVWLKVTDGDWIGRGRHLFSRGGWICPACVKRYATPRKKR